MECRKCGKDLAGEEHKMVADWPFCLDCFQQLMDKPEKEAEAETVPGPEAQVDTEKMDVAVEVVAETAKPRCQICDKDLEGDQYKKVGIWVFCPECYTDLAPRPKPPPPPETEEETGEDEEEAALHARFNVKYMHRVKCTECSRMIPEGGSSNVDGEPYCPDCYYALPEEVRQAAEEAEAAKMGDEEAVPAELPKVEAVPGCESCGKEVSEASLQIVEGFAICQACLSADAEMAVHLARARHQKRLQRLKDELGS
ncbi:MAG: hypothetical protein JRF64_00100 [Deltaproteobacteria bacterium]|nr:hypothetical protein [Deltaproteobacteria bacterium]